MSKRYIDLLTKFSKVDISKDGYDFYYNKKENILHLDKNCSSSDKKINLTLDQVKDKKVHTLCFRAVGKVDPALDDLVSKSLAFETLFKKNGISGFNFQLSLVLEDQAKNFYNSLEKSYISSSFSAQAGKYIKKIENSIYRLEKTINESISDARREVYTLAALNLIEGDALKEGLIPSELKFEAFRRYINYPALLSDELLSKLFIRKFAMQTLVDCYPVIADLSEEDFEKLINEFDELIGTLDLTELDVLAPDFTSEPVELDRTSLSNSTIALALLRIHGLEKRDGSYLVKSLPEKFSHYLKVRV